MLEGWRREGLDTSLVMTTARKNTGLYFADTDKNGHRDYTYYRSDSAARLLFDLPESADILGRLAGYDLVYASAITLMILSDKNRERLVALFRDLRAGSVMTAFDTNYRPSGWSSPDEAAQWMNRIFPACDIVLPTNDENSAVFGDADDDAILARLEAAGVPEIAVKCGGSPCLISHGGTRLSVGTERNEKPLDTTSAGDSFNAAYLCARLRGHAPAKAAAWGHRLAGEVIRHRGAFIPKENLPVF
jgi:2-dehydro-3-deoxygluconokinase